MNQKLKKYFLTGLLQIQHYQEYLNIQILNNLIVLAELFPTPDLLD